MEPLRDLEDCMVNSAVQKVEENGLETAIVRALDKRSVGWSA